MLGFPLKNGVDQLATNLLLGFVRVRDIPLLKTQFPLTGEQQHELHHLEQLADQPPRLMSNQRLD